MHGYAVHTDLNGVSCRPICWTICEVQLNWLDWMNGRSEAKKDTFLSHQSLFLEVTLQCCLILLTHWSSISNSWLNTSWLKESVVCDDWFWDMALRNELSLQDKRDERSLCLQGDRSNHVHLNFTTHVLNLWLHLIWRKNVQLFQQTLLKDAKSANILQNS